MKLKLDSGIDSKCILHLAFGCYLFGSTTLRSRRRVNPVNLFSVHISRKVKLNKNLSAGLKLKLEGGIDSKCILHLAFGCYLFGSTTRRSRRRVNPCEFVQITPSIAQNKKALSTIGPFCFVWRRGWDLNPRRATNPCWFSRPVHSTALPPLRCLRYVLQRRHFEAFWQKFQAQIVIISIIWTFWAHNVVIHRLLLYLQTLRREYHERNHSKWPC